MTFTWPQEFYLGKSASENLEFVCCFLGSRRNRKERGGSSCTRCELTAHLSRHLLPRSARKCYLWYGTVFLVWLGDEQTQGRDVPVCADGWLMRIDVIGRIRAEEHAFSICRFVSRPAWNEAKTHLANTCMRTSSCLSAVLLGHSKLLYRYCSSSY